MKVLFVRLRRSQDCLDLHLVDLGIQDAQSASARSEHWIALVDLLDALQHSLELRELGELLDAGLLDLRA